MKVLKTQKNSKNCIVCGMDNPFGLHAPFYVLEDNTVATIEKGAKVKTISEAFGDGLREMVLTLMGGEEN